MQIELGGFNPVHVARLLAVSRAYFCADLASVVNARKRRAGVTPATLRQPVLRPQCAPPNA